MQEKLDTLIVPQDIAVGIYQQLLEKQTNDTTIFITILLGIVVILLGATWWWNKSGANALIEEEVKKNIQNTRDAIISELKGYLDAEIDNKVKQYGNKLNDVEANACRLLALAANSRQEYSYSIYWWSQFLEINIKENNAEGIRIGISLIKSEIDYYLKKPDNSKIYLGNDVKNAISSLPKILKPERDEILLMIKDKIDAQDSPE